MPPILKATDEIYLLSTARAMSAEQRTAFVQQVAALGFSPIAGRSLSMQQGVLAGTDADRLADLQAALDHPTAQAIWCGRGGYGTSRLLDALDWTAYRRQPKWVVGFSDTTALLAAALAAGGYALHGVMGFQAGQPAYAGAWQGVKSLLMGAPMHYHWPASTHCLPGTASGRLVGGNLSLLAHMVGCRQEFDYQDAILFIEEIDEYLYSLDRMLVQLARSGRLAHIRGVVLGAFTQIQDNADPFGLSLAEILIRAFQGRGIPVAFGFPAGHEPPNLPLVLGAQVQLSQAVGTWQLAEAGARQRQLRRG
ncbi:MAG: LD-carboxypeptidase [Sphingobacteriia bacterium]|jgi:muramoyltetrapeptide carboxypeptidase